MSEVSRRGRSDNEEETQPGDKDMDNQAKGTGKRGGEMDHRKQENEQAQAMKDGTEESNS